MIRRVLRSAACVLVLVACGRGEDHAPTPSPAPAPAGPVASPTFPLGRACCDPAIHERLVLGEAATRDARQLEAAGGQMWSSRAPVDVELCGVRVRPAVVTLTVFHQELAQATWECAGAACGPTTCEQLFAACTAQLGPPRLRRGVGPTPELARYVTPTTFVRISQVQGQCTVALQDVRVIMALDQVLDAATDAAHAPPSPP